MMVTADSLISLQDEFEGLIQVICRDKKLTCFLQSKKCNYPLSKATLERLAELLTNIVELLKDDGQNVEVLLKEASSLVMCIRRHQDQGVLIFKEWIQRIPAKKLTLAQGGVNLQEISSTPAIELPKICNPTVVPPKEQKVESAIVVDIRRSSQETKSEPGQSSFDTDFDDEGFQSFNEDVLDSRITTKIASSSSSEHTEPHTPQKAAKIVSTDSGISMSFDRSDEADTERSTKYRDGSESPLTGRLSRTQRAAGGTRPSRPVLAHIQPALLPFRTKPNFAPFADPFVKLRDYIKQPLTGKNDMKQGCIYAFQLEGFAFTKIGLAADRDSQASIEASFRARMGENRRSGWSGLKVVLKKEVPHVHRLEKLVHYHLQAGRMRELRDKRSHTEWFNNSLDEIYTVVIAWKHWMLSMPYDLDIDTKTLRPEWRSRLETIQDHGGDNWLKWLCQHVPKLPVEITNAIQDTNSWVEGESTVEDRGFLRCSATGSKSEIKKSTTFPLC